MSEQNKALVRRWFDEVWNKGRAEAIDEMFAKDGIAHGLSDNPVKGPDGFRPFFQNFRTAFPDINIAIDHLISEGDLVMARCLVRGVHTGSGIGLDATQKPVSFSGMTICRVKDNKIVESWNNFDFLTMFQQLDAVKLPG